MMSDITTISSSLSPTEDSAASTPIPSVDDVDGWLDFAVKALQDFGRVYENAVRDTDNSNAPLLDAAYQLYQLYQRHPEIYHRDIQKWNIKLDCRANPFNPVVKILHAKAKLGQGIIKFASKQSKMLEALHMWLADEKKLPRETPDLDVKHGEVLAFLHKQGGVTRVQDQIADDRLGDYRGDDPEDLSECLDVFDEWLNAENQIWESVPTTAIGEGDYLAVVRVEKGETMTLNRAITAIAIVGDADAEKIYKKYLKNYRAHLNRSKSLPKPPESPEDNLLRSDLQIHMKKDIL